MGVTPERVREVILMFVPIGLGIFLIIWGIVEQDWGLVSIGGGLLGIPGLSLSIKGVKEDVGAVSSTKVESKNSTT